MVFEGDTVSDTIAKVLQTEPAWDRLPGDMPANVKVLLRRCLEKDANQRLQHIGDAVIEINETLHAPAVAPPITGSEATESKAVSWGSRAIYGVIGLLIGVIAMGIGLRHSKTPKASDGDSSPAQHLAVTLPENQTLALSRSMPLGWAQPAISISPDGTQVVYVAETEGTSALFLRPLNTFEATRITGTERAFYPFFSPDGQSVGFFTEDKLKTVSLLGGDP